MNKNKVKHLSIMATVTMYDYTPYRDMALIHFLNAGRVEKSAFNNFRKTNYDVPLNIWLDKQNNNSYSGFNCVEGMLSDAQLYCDAIINSRDCITGIIQEKDDKNCNPTRDFVSSRCTFDTFENLGLFCRDSNVKGQITQKFLDSSKDMIQNLTENCTLLTLQESTTTYTCDGETVYSLNSLSTFYDTIDLNPKNITALKINLTDFSKMSFSELKKDFKSSFQNLGYYQLITIYVACGSAIVITITIIIYLIKFKRCCKRKAARVNFLGPNVVFRSNGQLNKRRIKRKLRKTQKSFEGLLTSLAKSCLSDYRVQKAHNNNKVSMILANIDDALMFLGLYKEFSSSPRLIRLFNDFVQELDAYEKHALSVDLVRTYLKADIPSIDSEVVNEYRSLISTN